MVLLDKEIVILTTDGSRQKFTMKRGYIRMNATIKKYNFQDNDTQVVLGLWY
jgi:hypothetical protein